MLSVLMQRLRVVAHDLRDLWAWRLLRHQLHSPEQAHENYGDEDGGMSLTTTRIHEYPLQEGKPMTKLACNKIGRFTSNPGVRLYPNDVVGVSNFNIFRGLIQSRAAAQRC